MNRDTAARCTEWLKAVITQLHGWAESHPCRKVPARYNIEDTAHVCAMIRDTAAGVPGDSRRSSPNCTGGRSLAPAERSRQGTTDKEDTAHVCAMNHDTAVRCTGCLKGILTRLHGRAGSRPHRNNKHRKYCSSSTRTLLVLMRCFPDDNGRAIARGCRKPKVC